jgi:hypothetical protein
MPAPARPLAVIGVTNFDLFCTRCPCGELTIHGFWHQLDKDVNAVRKRAVVRLPCVGCGSVRTRVFRLTTGRGTRRRLAPWSRLMVWCFIHPRFPRRLFDPARRLFGWLERNFPI